jgi:hypothetical protein
MDTKMKHPFNSKIQSTNRLEPVYCLQFYVRLGPESPLDKIQIMEDRLSSGTGSMPKTWPGRSCS